MKWIFTSLFLILFILNATTVFAEYQHIKGPWLTGPLIATDGHTVPPGHVNIETYLFMTDNYDEYNNNWGLENIPSVLTISPELEGTIGLSTHSDFEFLLPYNFNSSKGGSASGLADSTLILGFQILEAHEHSWEPDCRFTLSETFPAGKYDKLNPEKLGADGIGMGSYQTGIATNFQKLYHLKTGKFLELRLDLSYTILLSTHVTGISVYGGARGTKGRVNPGNNFTADFALEYTITQHWANALDVILSTSGVTSFKGFPGITSSGMPGIVGKGRSASISLAPAIEYNFSANAGIIAGVWFTAIGKNSPAFVSGVIAGNFYI